MKNAKFIIRRSTDKQFFVTFKAKNGKKWNHTETYTRKRSAVTAAHRMKAEAANALIVDETAPVVVA